MLESSEMEKNCAVGATELKKQQEFLAIHAEGNQQLMQKRQQFASAAKVKPELFVIARQTRS